MPLSKALKLLVVLAVIALALTVTTYSITDVNKNVSSYGTITTTPNLGVFSDSGCTISMSTINWGSVQAGTSVNQTVYVENTGTGTMTLGLIASNWSPSTAATYLTVTWNQQGTQLTAGQSTEATITLTVASTVTGFTSFSNTITLTGTG